MGQPRGSFLHQTQQRREARQDVFGHQKPSGSRRSGKCKAIGFKGNEGTGSCIGLDCLKGQDRRDKWKLEGIDLS